MKCMNKQARNNKAEFEHEREQARFDSLTPEEQEKELADKTERSKRAREKAFTLGSFVSTFNGSYENFKI